MSEETNKLIERLEKAYVLGKGIRLSYNELSLLINELLREYDKSAFRLKRRHYKNEGI